MAQTDLEIKGIDFIDGLIEEHEFYALKEEMQHLFSKNILFGHGFSVHLSPFRREVPDFASKIKSINLYELAIDVINVINKSDSLKSDDYVLAHIAGYSEKNNRKPLPFHSDFRSGRLIRAQLCLLGSGPNSGAFQYYTGSHKIEKLSYYPSSDFISNNSGKLVSSPEANGTISLIDTYGYHGKMVCAEERISIMFDFLPREYVVSNIDDCYSLLKIRTDQLSDKVLSNINVFRVGATGNPNSPNTFDSYSFNKLFGGLFRSSRIIWSLNYIVKKIIGR